MRAITQHVDYQELSSSIERTPNSMPDYGKMGFAPLSFPHDLQQCRPNRQPVRGDSEMLLFKG